MGSLRRRYVVQTALAIAALFAAFALVTLVAVGMRFLIISEVNARTVVASLGNVDEGVGARAAAVLKSFSSPLDPHVEVQRPDGSVAALSRNQRQPLARAPLGLRLGPFPAYRVSVQQDGWRVTVDWPLAPTLDLMHDLVLVLAVTTALAAGAGAVLGRYTIHRILAPVEAMSQAARALREGRGDFFLPDLGDSDDEFANLARTLSTLLQDLAAQRQRDREFLARAAHELRTPLQILSGNLRLLAERELDPDEELASIQAMRRAVVRMTRLTSDLLALEHAAAVSPRRRPVHIRQLLEQMAEDARALSPDRTVAVEAEVVEASVDEDGLKRALWALVENALSYSPPGSEVRLAARAEDEDLVLTVADTGPGIPPDERERVFERFYRGTHAKVKEGTGLGLAIVRSLIEAQDGSVSLEANEPTGTLAVVRLPGAEPRRVVG